MLIPNRHNSSNSYRYGFNGKEKDDELKGEGNHIDYGMRIYDDRVGRFLSVDPLTKTYPHYTPYQFAGNTPMAAIDLDGEEPKIVVTNIVTGYTYMHVYGEGDVKTILVKTYKAIVQYTDKKGNITVADTFNVTRDGWFGLGTDKNKNTFLHNRSVDQIGSAKIIIEYELPNHYTNNTSAFRISPIYSPFPKEYNQNYLENGEKGRELELSVKREGNGFAVGAEFHEGGLFDNKKGDTKLAGAYGCFSVVHPSQIIGLKKQNFKPSNFEMNKFRQALEKVTIMQLDEHDFENANIEVEIQKRSYNKTKTVPKT